MVLVLLPTCVVLLFCLLPTVAAAPVERARERYLTVTVGSLNLCGALPAVMELWGRGQSFGAARVEYGALVLAMGCRERTRGALRIPGGRGRTRRGRAP